ncbi:MAG: pilus assembly PilX N-terminal domain-containing protein [bacterium]|nr:pilus assembly PilX N-terminal domain-containing protein [bacterium]MDD5756272.1 pilus assembly PilX N-terminal domain-containing protein [bacterium]
MSNPSGKADIINTRGNTIIFGMIVVFIVFIIGTSMVMLSENETKKSVASIQKNTALYIAEGGIRKAVWELDHDDTYIGEADSTLGNGKFTVSVTTPAGLDDQRQIISTGKSGSFSRTIKIICERITTDVMVNGAVQLNGEVKVKGDSEIIGATKPAIIVPVGVTPQIQKEENVTGSPSSWGNSDFPAFEDTFGVSIEQLDAMATTKYTNPGNNPDCHGITWVDGDLKATSSTFNGSGILIVNGDCDINGGVFNGVIYVLGTLTMTGNGVVHGAVLCASNSESTFSAGTPQVIYDEASILSAGNFFPFHILTWQEVKN